MGPQLEGFLSALPHFITRYLHFPEFHITFANLLFSLFKPLNSDAFFPQSGSHETYSLKSLYNSGGVSPSGALIKLCCRVARRLPRHVLSFTLEHTPAFRGSASPHVRGSVWRAEEPMQVPRRPSPTAGNTCFGCFLVFVAKGFPC